MSSPSYITPYPNGISSFGVPLVGSSDFYHANQGRHWWVNSVVSQFQDGTTPKTPFATMAQAFAVCGSGDIIHMNGNVREQIDTPVGVFDVTVIGEGNLPRNADAHTGNNGTIAAATWKLPASPSTTLPLVRVLQQGWRFVNILFNGPSAGPAIRVYRDNGAGDAERDASHIDIIACRFTGGQDHIETNGGPNFVNIRGCYFLQATGLALKQVVGAGAGTNSFFRILDNQFHNNANHIIMPASYATIKGNTFGRFTTIGIDLRAGTAGYNIVWGNALAGTYSNIGGYWAGANDEWGGNFNSLAGGVTAALPA